MTDSNTKLYIGYSDKQTYTSDEPNLLVETIDFDFDQCLFKTAWALESQGAISEADAEHMDVALADELDIHIMGISVKTAQAIGRAVKNVKN